MTWCWLLSERFFFGSFLGKLFFLNQKKGWDKHTEKNREEITGAFMSLVIFGRSLFEQEASDSPTKMIAKNKKDDRSRHDLGGGGWTGAGKSI